MTSPALDFRGLKIDVPGPAGPLPLIRDVTLSVGHGEIVGLVGESGSGKSLSALAALGFAPADSRVSGQIRIGDFEVIGAPADRLREVRGRRCAMIFQDATKSLNPYFTLGRQLSDVVSLNRGLSHRDAVDVVTQNLADMNLPDPGLMVGKYPHQLSGGQLQRAMIAMALSCEPEVLLADEPTTALDVTVQAQILVLLRELARQRNLSILFITHDLGVVAALCDRVAVMYAGTIVETAWCTELFANAMHPYTRKLLATAPVLGRGRATLPNIPGRVPELTDRRPGCLFAPRCERATELCREVRPLLLSHEPGHAAACHHPHRIDEVTAREDIFP
ncbi:ABC transporter ATP-binding protein [Hoeflea sp. WL0058]|uniref:ABC transporter ATP-binding protein n=1 Tax=Flavimaribacter sediminis TaxID=2865987 RepID=A0AAE3D1G1_9HYPH|nr:ABC transporter ATP-binding protein [Flavimaribacter sediminis]MBW8637568.1 ABC transporter ATP-binding protein [Flavimaribacter sediminis]